MDIRHGHPALTCAFSVSIRNYLRIMWLKNKSPMSEDGLEIRFNLPSNQCRAIRIDLEWKELVSDRNSSFPD